MSISEVVARDKYCALASGVIVSPDGGRFLRRLESGSAFSEYQRGVDDVEAYADLKASEMERLPVFGSDALGFEAVVGPAKVHIKAILAFATLRFNSAFSFARSSKVSLRTSHCSIITVANGPLTTALFPFELTLTIVSI